MVAQMLTPPPLAVRPWWFQLEKSEKHPLPFRFLAKNIGFYFGVSKKRFTFAPAFEQQMHP